MNKFRTFYLILIAYVVLFSVATLNAKLGILALFAVSAACVPVLWRKLPRHAGLALWLAGTAQWLFMIHFIRYPHPINWALWVGFAAYLGGFLPLFVFVTRNFVWRLIPKLLFKRCGRKVFTPGFRFLSFLFAGPFVWAGCDVLRGWGVTSLSFGSLCHMMYDFPLLIQTADLLGEWFTTATFVFLAICLSCAVQNSRKLWKPALLLGVAMLLLVSAYGELRTWKSNENPEIGRFMLVQGDVPASMTVSPELEQETEEMYFPYALEMLQTSKEPVDAVIFPECIYREMVFFSAEKPALPPGLGDAKGNPLTLEEFRTRISDVVRYSHEELLYFCKQFRTGVLTGCTVERFGEDGIQIFNSAIFVPQDARSVEYSNVYNKMHLVPCGEYVPGLKTVAKIFPAVEKYVPFASVEPGAHPVVVRIPTTDGHSLSASVNICFESVVGRFIRRQIAYEIQNEGGKPDCMINVTHDGWFRRSHAARMHMVCSVFRAIENRTPVLVAANFGDTTQIDSCGRILQTIPTGERGVIFATVRPDERVTFFTRFGFATVWIPVTFLLLGCWKGKKRKIFLLFKAFGV